MEYTAAVTIIKYKSIIVDRWGICSFVERNILRKKMKQTPIVKATPI